MHAKSLVKSDSVQPYGLEPARLLCPWDPPSKNTVVCCHTLLHWNLPNPGIKPMSPALAGRSPSTEPPGKFLWVYLKGWTPCSSHSTQASWKPSCNPNSSPYTIYVDVFSGHFLCNKLPQIWWLKTTSVYSLIVLKVRSLKFTGRKSRYQRGPHSLQRL